MFDLKYQQLISPWNGVSVGFNMVAIQMDTIWHFNRNFGFTQFRPDYPIAAFAAEYSKAFK